MNPDERDIPVDGGTLRLLYWGNGEHLAVAIHGITASAMSWRGVARRMPADWTLVAADLRGRGYSNGLPRPYGMDQHVADVAAILKRFAAQRPVLVGHSMGAYVALLTLNAYPELARKLVLLDGGLPSPFPLPEGSDPDAVLDAGLGPAIARLRQVFPSADAYVEFFRQHPALGPHWTDDVEAYVRYDVQPAPSGGGIRSRAVEEAVRADGRDLLLGSDRIGAALTALTEPTPLLTAPAGLFGEAPGIQPPELVEHWQERAPMLRPQLVPDVNHYTLIFDPAAVTVVIEAITGLRSGPAPDVHCQGAAAAPRPRQHAHRPGRRLPGHGDGLHPGPRAARSRYRLAEGPITSY
jgi:lipase